MRKRKPSLRVGLPVLAIAVAIIIIAWVNVQQSLQNGRPPPCFPQTCPSLGYFAILGLVGLFIAFWASLETLMGFLIHVGQIEFQPGPLPTPQPGSGLEDDNILAMARELQRKFKRPKYGEITSVAWLEGQPWYWAGWKRKSLRKPFILLLSADLRGRLELEEWRILLTYYFLHIKPRLGIFLKYLGSIAGAFMLIPIGGVLVATEYGLQGGIFYGQFIAAPAAVVLLILIFPLGKRVALRVDKWASEVVGQRALLDLFKKIDSFQLPRVENAKRRHGWTLRLWPMPNITERIQNLTDD